MAPAGHVLIRAGGLTVGNPLRWFCETILQKMEAAHQKRDPADEAELDANFHMAIIEASHNVVMLHMMRAMYDLLRQGVFYNRQMMFKNRLTRDVL